MGEIVAPRDGSTGWRRRLATMLRRYPWGARLLHHTYRLLQPRFSVGVVGVLLDAAGERVLVVEHVLHTISPWGLPGGWIARGEDPARTVEREIYEETGLRVRVVRLLLVERTLEYRRHLDIVYLCALDGEAQRVRLSRELLDYRWAPGDALPPLLAVHERAVRMALALER